MLVRTHFVCSILAALFFISSVPHPILFFSVVVIAGLIPDIDSTSSYLGKHRVFRPIQWFLKHRGAFHSLTLCTILSVILALVYPPLAFPFFLGYAIHLIADSFTIEGIRPFWPLTEEVRGRIHTGGRFENSLFIVLSLLAVFLGVSLLL